MQFKASLNEEEVIRFCIDFYALEVARMTEVRTRFEDLKFQVLLSSKNPEAEILLRNSFKDGMLAHKGWDKMFIRT